jgi:cyclophilin family peptidyl-prolyl cis-trans isomerase
MRPALLLLGLLAFTSSAKADSPPRVANERIVLRTVAGDIVLAFYPDVAPKHVEQLLKLARLGVFDTTNFCRVEPGFVLQLSLHLDRRTPLTRVQAAAVHEIPAEFSTTLKHHRGILSMAREDGKPDSGTTSFSVLLGDAPHLDGQYTIFGYVEKGMDVVDELVKTPCNGNRPLAWLGVFRAEVIDSPADLAAKPLAEVQPLTVEAQPAPAQLPPDQGGTPFTWGVNGVLSCIVVLMVSAGVVSVMLAARLSFRHVLSVHLITVLVGTFLLFLILVPMAHGRPTLAVVLFVGLLSVLKLMGRFESQV